jgi:hypothetical protein
MKEGNLKEYHGEGSIGNVSSKFTFEGPIVKDKASFVVSARRTYIDILAAPLVLAVNRAAGNSDKFRADIISMMQMQNSTIKFRTKTDCFLAFIQEKTKPTQDQNKVTFTTTPPKQKQLILI